MSNIIWKDNSEPAKKFGSWPYAFTREAFEATQWQGFDAETGIQRHWIVRDGISFCVMRKDGRLRDLNFMTLEHAKAYCENRNG